MAERSPLGILAGEADRSSGRQQRRKCQRFGRSPVDDPSLGNGCGTAIELRPKLAIEREALRNGDELVAPRHETRAVDLRQDGSVEGVAAGELAAGDVRRQRAFDRAARFLQTLRRLVDHRLRLLRRDDALIDQLVGEELADGRMILDSLGHLRLGVRRLVLFVVTEATVTDEVDERIASEGAAEVHRQMHGGNARVDVVGVDVNDRNVEAFGEVGGVPGRARVVGIGREPNLIVGDEMQGAAGFVTGQRLHVEDFRDDALAGEGRVAVN